MLERGPKLGALRRVRGPGQRRTSASRRAGRGLAGAGAGPKSPSGPSSSGGDFESQRSGTSFCS